MKPATLVIFGAVGAAIWAATRDTSAVASIATAPGAPPANGQAVFTPPTNTTPPNTSNPDAAAIQQAQLSAASLGQHIAAVLSQAQYLMTNSGLTPAGATQQLASIQTAAQTAYAVLQTATTLSLVNQALATLQTADANATAALQAITAAIAAAHATTTPPAGNTPSNNAVSVSQALSFYNMTQSIAQSAKSQTEATGIYPGGALDQIAQALHDGSGALTAAQNATSSQTAMAAASAAQIAYSSAVTALQTLESIIAQIQQQQQQQHQTQPITSGLTLAQVEDQLYAKISALPAAVLHTQGDGSQVPAAVPPYIYVVGDPSDPRIAPLGMRQATQAQVDELRPLLAAQSSLEGH